VSPFSAEELEVSDPLASGDYARKQIYCPSRVVAWSHGSRFRLAARLASVAAGGRLLDYGCGDGTFMALTHGTFAEAVGADIDAKQLAECARRLADLPGLVFVQTADLYGPQHDRAYEVVTCMEVLEHCVDAERVRVLDHLRGLMAPGGHLVISVPIEIGPSLAGKQFFRAVAAWRGHGDYQYRETYSPRELLAATLARPNLARAHHHVDTPSGTIEYCGHKGFDWRILEREIQERFVVQRRLFTPLGPLGPLLNSQVWFVCKPR
jgi:2-polyprenyl-3-methyl-5-hydroxy-6-metoxy-1,4-benzoquinol methylase